ncbi:SulP family inorganic anion transporter [Marinigracilibium pacificum]|uniref:SulP family inorganic anion transporter n=1 Tax=Marinigracilibium pacificum TaxID=2729599 RepID=A0A848J0W3_9BACT|nr:SulP family inorganic anion transporter [Marinigracilibium pacificum]NMM48998.1 SulP family inorganic anion transporter [Marinigracilibium pacificum]
MSLKEGFFSNIKYDLPASIIVFLVAVPLCLGIALASEAPMFAGIIAGIVGGIVVGFFSGSSLGVSGPAAGLVAIVISAQNTLGSFEALLAATVLAGIIQITLGFMKAGIIGYYFPNSVIKGMLTAIGIIIILKQIPHAVGYDGDYEGDLSFWQADGHNTFSELYYMLDFLSPGAILITVISLAILIIWEQPFMKKNKVFTLIQGPLVAVVAGIVLNYLFKGNNTFGLNSDQLVSLPTPKNLTEFLGNFRTPDFNIFIDNSSAVLLAGVTIAVVASIETLLSVEATDKLDPQKRITPTNKELKAQGIGNLISGMIGGLPITQVIVRSSANIQSGGKTKASAIIHGVMLLASVLLFPNVLNQIPYASLAAVLFLVGYKLAKPSLFTQMWKNGITQFVPFVVTVIAIVATDLLVGIGIGLAVAIFIILYYNLKNPFYFKDEDHINEKEVTIELSEEVSFLNKAAILKALNTVPENSNIVVDATKTKVMDFDVSEILKDFRTTAGHKNIKYKVIGWPKENPMKDSERHFAETMVIVDNTTKEQTTSSQEI